MSLQVIISSCPEQHAANLAEQLLKLHLAACVNIVPAVRSLYRWQGTICDERESLLIIKTTRGDELFQQLPDLHPYDVPEIIALSPDTVLPSYLEWALQQCHA